MPIRQRLSTTSDGREVVVKQAPPGPLADRQEREAASLRAAAHPGVVEVIAERRLDDGGHELMVASVGPHTAADVRTNLAGVAGLVVSLATTVADLHDLGIAHTRITAAHVLVDAAHRPVLCGFAEAVVVDGGSPPAALRAVDVGGLGDLLRSLVAASTDGAEIEWEPAPARRLRRGDRWSGFARRALLNVADRATADDLEVRPDARAFADAVLAALPEARLPGAAGATPDDPSPSSWPDRVDAARSDLLGRVGRSAGAVPWSAIAGAVGLGLLVFGISGLTGDPAGRAVTETVPDAEPLVAATEAAPSSTAPPASAAEPDGPDGSGCRPVDAPAADPDGDGCAEPVSFLDGAVEVGGVRYAVGEPDDLLAVGDWDCDGAATVALVERRSGSVYFFDGWAEPGAELAVAASGAVAGPRGIEVVASGGCDALVVDGHDGSRTELAP